MSTLKTLYSFIFCSFVLCLVGCSDGLARVEGTVTINGQPIEISSTQRGLVMFQPVSGGPTGTGGINDNGEYQISVGSQKGLPPGEYRVSVNSSEIIPSKDPQMPPSHKLITPPKFSNPRSSGLEFTIEEGNNTIDLNLEF